MIRIIIADDQAIFREGLKKIVAENQGLSVTGEADSWQELINLLENQICDMVLLDINILGINRLPNLKQLKTKALQLPVLILSTYPDNKYAIRALKAGADGYFSKSSDPVKIIKAIRQIVSGGKYISSSLVEKLVYNLDKTAGLPTHENLSKREIQVLHEIALGKTVTQIAKEMHLSVKTISTFRTRVLKKMQLKSNSDLIRYALKKGLVE